MKLKLPKLFKKGFRAYYLLVVSIIVLTIAIQSMIQYSLNKQRSTALVVNLAGRQRMLSQRVLNELYSCRYHNCDYAELKLSLNKLVQMNSFLQEGNENLSIDPLDEEEIIVNFRKLEPHLLWINSQLGDFDNIENVPFNDMRYHVDRFLIIMDDIVFQFQKKSEDDIRAMMIIEVELAIFSVFIVLFEIFFIVNPIINRILNQKKKLKEIAWHQSHVLSSHLKNLKDMNYVLKIEKNQERQLEIIKFISQELDSLNDSSANMQTALKETEEVEMPHTKFLNQVEDLLAKYNVFSSQKSEVSHDDKVHSEESKTHDTAVQE
ncbi:type IV pili methyl-accepting chemotaxis transducer N-terminal domain-containing protein [Croceivirga thetidis]|uniref:NarX-like N-terminal domain-containing protein n=1 Tax=Croceivirga thetidis TaxID=2721623 RepID=A0ABX1GV39_9FLAO|nr:type IV pili methyl-accepting chemotaxis transducer N-terminal domain-containing protein [Croceivirga thetidis]NKI32607.1 hypothetical protein [Croceivirga thetidis]